MLFTIVWPIRLRYSWNSNGILLVSLIDWTPLFFSRIGRIPLYLCDWRNSSRFLRLTKLLLCLWRNSSIFSRLTKFLLCLWQNFSYQFDLGNLSLPAKHTSIYASILLLHNVYPLKPSFILQLFRRISIIFFLSAHLAPL